MDKRDYELLLALDQHKNITKAAQSLYMTQPATVSYTHLRAHET